MDKQNNNKIIFRIKIITFILMFLILAFFVYSIINYAVLENQVEEGLNDKVVKYGYITVFILTMILEAAPQPFIGGLVPFTNALILGLDYKLLLLMTILGSILSSYLSYVFGLAYGKRVIIKFTGKDSFQKYQDTFKKYGKVGMALIAITPVPYFPVLPGLFKMNIKNFTIYAIFPRIIHYLVYGYIISLIF